MANGEEHTEDDFDNYYRLVADLNRPLSPRARPRFPRRRSSTHDGAIERLPYSPYQPLASPTLRTRSKSASPVRNRPNVSGNITIIRHEMRLENGFYVILKNSESSQNDTSATSSKVSSATSWRAHARPVESAANISVLPPGAFTTDTIPAMRKCSNRACSGNCDRAAAYRGAVNASYSGPSSQRKDISFTFEEMPDRPATDPKPASKSPQCVISDVSISSEEPGWKEDVEYLVSEEITCLESFHSCLQKVCNQMRVLEQDVTEAGDSVNSLRAQQKASAENLQSEARSTRDRIQQIQHNILGLATTSSVMEITTAQVVSEFGKLVVAARYMEDATAACKKADKIIRRNERVQRGIKRYLQKHVEYYQNPTLANDPNLAVANDPNLAVVNDQNLAVANDQNFAVANDQNLAVENDQNPAVANDQNLAVANDQNLAVANDVNLAIANDNLAFENDDDFYDEDDDIYEEDDDIYEEDDETLSYDDSDHQYDWLEDQFM